MAYNPKTMTKPSRSSCNKIKLIRFLESGDQIALYDTTAYHTIACARTSIATTIRRNQFPISTVVRDDCLYLVRRDKINPYIKAGFQDVYDAWKLSNAEV